MALQNDEGDRKYYNYVTVVVPLSAEAFVMS